MAIQFKCPHCQKAYKLKDELAGKKATCAGCKRIITVPAAAGPVDVEAEALSAFADEPPPPVEMAAKDMGTIDFECPMCTEKIHMAAALAGKQAPCPECRRIIRVPAQVKKAAKDWRKADAHLPSGARRDTAPAPDGAWGNLAAGGVSVQALKAAGAIKEERESVPLSTWLIRGGLATAVLLVVFCGGYAGWVWWAGSARDSTVAQALAEVQNKQIVSEAAGGEVARGAGEYYVRSDRAADARKCLNEARQRLLSDLTPEARKRLTVFDLTPEARQNLKGEELGEEARKNVKPDDLSTEARQRLFADCEVWLLEVLRSQLDLPGDEAQAKAGSRIPWQEAQKDVEQTLRRFSVSETRAMAFRMLIVRWLPRGQGNRLAAMINPGNFPADELAELEGMLGLEMLRANQKEAAEARFDQAVLPYTVAEVDEGGGRPKLAAYLVALAKVLNKPEIPAGKANAFVDSTNKDIGQAIALAHQGQLDQAKSALDKLGAQERLKVLIAILEGQPDKVGDLTDRITTAVESEKRVAPAWTLYRLTQALLAKGGNVELAAKVAGAITDPVLGPMAKLEAMRGQLPAKKKANDNLAEGIGTPESLAQLLAKEAVIRHNARYASSSEAQQAVAKWPANSRPVGLIAVALGVQDSERGK